MKDGCERRIVVPAGEKLQHDIEEALARLGISTLRFRLNKSGAIIVS